MPPPDAATATAAAAVVFPAGMADSPRRSIGASGPARLVVEPAVRSCEDGSVTPVDDIVGDAEMVTEGVDLALLGSERAVGEREEPRGGVEILVEPVREAEAGTGVVSREEEEL